MVYKLSDYVLFIYRTNLSSLKLINNNNISYESWGEVEGAFQATLDNKISLITGSFACYDSVGFTYDSTDNSLVGSSNCTSDPTDGNCCAVAGNVVGFQL